MRRNESLGRFDCCAPGRREEPFGFVENGNLKLGIGIVGAPVGGFEPENGRPEGIDHSSLDGMGEKDLNFLTHF